MTARLLNFAVAGLISAACSALSAPALKEALTTGVSAEPAAMASAHEKMTNLVNSAPTGFMKAPGLAGLLGGARVKLLSAGSHRVVLPLPQLTEAQIPVCYAITTKPVTAVREYRLRTREASNAVVSVELSGDPQQEVEIAWSAIVLAPGKPESTEAAVTKAYARPTGCAQSSSDRVKALAEKLWPASGKVDAYAAAIQEFIRNMKREKPLRSLDAVGTLESGGYGICTANANLAAALLRSKDIPARSVAVIPPMGQRLEMHRIVDYFDHGQWVEFDPSSLQADIPLKPWQNIIMAYTTLNDEELAMTPRMGTSLGCPYGQELECLDPGVTLWGSDFFWTLGKPVAEFDANAEAVALARKNWTRFMETGKLSPNQIKAASANSAAGFLDALRVK